MRPQQPAHPAKRRRSWGLERGSCSRTTPSSRRKARLVSHAACLTMTCLPCSVQDSEWQDSEWRRHAVKRYTTIARTCTHLEVYAPLSPDNEANIDEITTILAPVLRLIVPCIRASNWRTLSRCPRCWQSTNPLPQSSAWPKQRSPWVINSNLVRQGWGP